MSSGRYDLQSRKLHLRENPSAGTFRKLPEGERPSSPAAVGVWKSASIDSAYLTNQDSPFEDNRSVNNETTVGRTDSLSSKESAERPISKSSSDSMDIRLPSGGTDLSWEEFEKEASRSLSLDSECGITTSTLKSEKDKTHAPEDSKARAHDGDKSKRHSGLISYLTRNLRKHGDTAPKKKAKKSKSRQDGGSESSDDGKNKSKKSKATGANGNEVQEPNSLSQVYPAKSEPAHYEDYLYKDGNEMNDSKENATCDTLSENSSSSNDVPIYSTPSKLPKIESSTVSHVSSELHGELDSFSSMQTTETMVKEDIQPSNNSNEENVKTGHTSEKPDTYLDSRQKPKTFKLEATILIDSEDDLDENTLTYFGPVYLSPQKETHGSNTRIVVTPGDSRVLRSPTPSEEELLTKYVTSPGSRGDGNMLTDSSQVHMESHGTLHDVEDRVNFESATTVTSFASPSPSNQVPFLPLSSLAQVVHCQLEPMASHRSLETDKMAESSSGPADNQKKPDDPALEIKSIQDNETRESPTDNIEIEALSGSMVVDMDDARPSRPVPMVRDLVEGKRVNKNGNEKEAASNEIETDGHMLTKSRSSSTSSSSSSDSVNGNEESVHSVKSNSEDEKENAFNVREKVSSFGSEFPGEGLSVKIVPTRKHEVEYLDPHKFLVHSPNTGQKVLDLTGALEIPVSETCVLQEDVEATLGIPMESSDILEQTVAAEIVEECVKSSMDVVSETPKHMDDIRVGEICGEEHIDSKQEKGIMEICEDSLTFSPDDTEVKNALQQLDNAVDKIECENVDKVNNHEEDEKQKIREECPEINSSLNSSKSSSSSSSSESPSSNLDTEQFEKTTNTSNVVETEEKYEMDKREFDKDSIDGNEQIHNGDTANESGDHVTSLNIECAQRPITERTFQASVLPRNEPEAHIEMTTHDSMALTDPEECNVLINDDLKHDTLHVDLVIDGHCDLDKRDDIKVESTEPNSMEKFEREEKLRPDQENEYSLKQIDGEIEKIENPVVSDTPYSKAVQKSEGEIETHINDSQNVDDDPEKLNSYHRHSSKSSSSSSSSSASSSHDKESSIKQNGDSITDPSIKSQSIVYPLKQEASIEGLNPPVTIDTPSIAREKCSETITISTETEPAEKIESVHIPASKAIAQCGTTHADQSTTGGIDGYLPDACHLVIEECVKPLSPTVPRAEPQLSRDIPIEDDAENQEKITSFYTDDVITVTVKEETRSSPPAALRTDPSLIVKSSGESATEDEKTKSPALSPSVPDNKEMKSVAEIEHVQPDSNGELDKNVAPCNGKEKETTKSEKKEKRRKKSGNTSLSTTSSSDSPHSRSSKISISKILKPIKRMISKDSDTYVVNKSTEDENASENVVETASEMDTKSSEISVTEPRTSTPRAETSFSTSSQVDTASDDTLEEKASNISQEHTTSPIAAPRRRKNKKHSDKDSSSDLSVRSASKVNSSTSSDSTPTTNIDTTQTASVDTTLTSQMTERSDDSRTTPEENTDTEPHYSIPWQSGYSEALSAAMGQYRSSICESKEMSEHAMSTSVDDSMSFDTDATTKDTNVAETLNVSEISHITETSEFNTSIASDAQSQNRKEKKKQVKEKKKEPKEEKKERRSREKNSASGKEHKRKDKKEHGVEKEKKSDEQKREKTRIEKFSEKIKKRKEEDETKSEEKKKSRKEAKTAKSDSQTRHKDSKEKKPEEKEKKLKERKKSDDTARKDDKKSKEKKRRKEVSSSAEPQPESTRPKEATKSSKTAREKKDKHSKEKPEYEKLESKEEKSSSSSDSSESGDEKVESVIKRDAQPKSSEVPKTEKESPIVSEETVNVPIQQEPFIETTVNVQTASERPSQTVIHPIESVEHKEGDSVPTRPPRTPKSKKSGRLSKLLPSIRSPSSKEEEKPDKGSSPSDKDVNFDGTYHREEDISADLVKEETKRMPRSSRVLNTVSDNLPYIDEVEPSPVTTPVTPPPESTHFVVVAIDFGTTHSGYAFSFTRHPSSIYMMRMWAGEEPGVANQKTLTSLLLDPEGRFHSFGYNARSSYLNLIPLEARHWLYFSKFKMELHNNSELNRETMLVAANGIRFPALRVFAYSLEFFKDHALQQLSDQSGTEILNEDIRWVITVPAIWKAPAKQFMRQAAYDAGLASPNFPEQLIIALEPEAASIYCRRLRMYQLVPDQPIKRPLQSPSRSSVEIANQDPAVTDLSIDSARPSSSSSADDLPDEVVDTKIKGSRYLVVDCGGGTVDITVHELDASGYITELHRATGGPHGSVGVDTEFERLLCAIFGLEFIEHYKRRYPMGWVHLMTDFESRKRSCSPYKNSFLNISPPFTFIHEFKKHKSDPEAAIKKYGDPGVEWSPQGMIRLSPVAMRKLFLPTVTRIKQEIGDVLNHPNARDLKYFFLVGGFAESPLLQYELRQEFDAIIKPLIPVETSLAVLKGAVQFGIDPSIVRVRRSRLTYGVGILNRFDPNRHPESKRVRRNGVDWCTDIFDKYVQTDQPIMLWNAVARSYTPAKPGQESIVLNIYSSQNPNVRFITDPGVVRCGTLCLNLAHAYSQEEEKRMTTQTTKGTTTSPREIRTRMSFGDTEINVIAVDVASGKVVKASVDFLGR